MFSKINLNKLLAELGQLRFWVDGSGAEMSVIQSGGLPFKSPTIIEAIKEISDHRSIPALHMMVNRLPPGVTTPKHVDFLKPSTHQPKYPILERYHLPIITNPSAYYWNEDEPESKIHMKAGFWYGFIKYWRLHEVGNLGDTERIHLIVDLDSPTPIGSYK